MPMIAYICGDQRSCPLAASQNQLPIRPTRWASSSSRAESVSPA